MSWRLPAVGRITSPFGPRKLSHAIGSYHYGTDLGSKRGTVYAAREGVVRTIWQTSRGAWVLDIRHPDESGQQIRTRYVHMYRDEITVRVGERVAAGQAVGRSGASGTPAAHLHFEVMVNGRNVDPVPFMRARGVTLGSLSLVSDVTTTPTIPAVPTVPGGALPPGLTARRKRMVPYIIKKGRSVFRLVGVPGGPPIVPITEALALEHVKAGMPLVAGSDADVSELEVDLLKPKQ